MRRWVLVAVVLTALVAAVGFVVTYVVKTRAVAGQLECRENLRVLALFAAHHANPPPGAPPEKLAHEVPAGTVVLPGVPPDDRLAWTAGVLPGLDQRRNPVAAVLSTLDPKQPWPAPPNQAAAQMKMPVFLCPGNPPTVAPDQPAPTQYVGIAGLGADAATLALPLPPAPAPPRAGCFRYDAPTPFDAITDGLSQTLLFGERSGDPGPWLRGGPSTVRGLDDSPGAKQLVGVGGQFGGNHAGVANWALADGSVRSLTGRADPKVLFGLATIAGKETDALPGE